MARRMGPLSAGCVCRAAPRVRSDMQRPDPPRAARGRPRKWAGGLLQEECYGPMITNEEWAEKEKPRCQRGRLNRQRGIVMAVAKQLRH